MDGGGHRVTVSRIIAKREHPAGFSRTLAMHRPNPKARLLLLCARIGYSPHASLQR
jgi:hypothetical protein